MNFLKDYDALASFEVPGKPAPKQRPRFYNGRAYTPQNSQIAENKIALHYLKKTKKAQKSLRSILIIIDFFIFSKNRGDIDNLAKTVLDGLNGLAYKDDRQVTSLICSINRVYSITDEKTEVKVFEKKQIPRKK